MNEPEIDSTAPSPRVESISDNLNFREIDTIIDNLSYGNLSSFCNNDKLKNALDKDAFIISNVASQLGITRACEYGLKLSTIIKNKALQLNESTVMELLDLIINVLTTTFCKIDDEHTLNENVDGQSDDELSSGKLGNRKTIDLVGVSKHFPSDVLSYSPLSWETLHLGSIINSTPSSNQRVKRINTNVINSSSYKEVKILEECDEELETKEHIDHMLKLIKDVTCDHPVKFWDFILDRSPIDGFNKTCFNLYSMTFLVAGGHVELIKDDDEILLKAYENKGNKKENYQAIITGWSYDYWLDLIKKYP